MSRSCCFNSPTKCLSFLSVDAGLILNHHKCLHQKDRERSGGYQNMNLFSFPGVHNLNFGSSDVNLCLFFAWHFGNIIKILITAQIICMVSNGPL